MTAFFLSRAECRLLLEYVRDRSGLNFEQKKCTTLAASLTRLLAGAACHSFFEFYQKMKNDTEGRLFASVVDAVTNTETYWFRDGLPFSLFRDTVLPGIVDELEARQRRAPVRIWSAGCSTGQEPYSIAMVILDHFRQEGTRRTRPTDFEIVATDISSAALDTAREGLYDRVAMSRGLSDEHRERYFTSAGRAWRVRDEVRELITFRTSNLLDPFAPLGNFDVVFFRNVAIYFTEETRREVLGRLHGVFPQGGWLFLGSTESHLFRPLLLERFDEYGAGSYYRAKVGLGAAEAGT